MVDGGDAMAVLVGYLAYFFRELFEILLHTLNTEPLRVEYTARLIRQINQQ